MPIEIRAIKSPKTDPQPDNANITSSTKPQAVTDKTPAERGAKANAKSASSKAVTSPAKTKTKGKKRNRNMRSFIEVKPVDVDAPPPALKPFTPLDIEEDGKFYQAIAQLSGTLVEVDGYLHLQHVNTQIKLKANRWMSRKLLQQLGQSVAVTGWPTHSGQQMQVSRISEPSEKSIFILAGLVKKGNEKGKINVLIARNPPFKTPRLWKFRVAVDSEIQPETKFIRCYVKYDNQGQLRMAKITANAPISPQYLKGKKASHK